MREGEKGKGRRQQKREGCKRHRAGAGGLHGTLDHYFRLCFGGFRYGTETDRTPSPQPLYTIFNDIPLVETPETRRSDGGAASGCGVRDFVFNIHNFCE